MNYSIVKYIMGWILNFTAAFMILPCFVAFLYQEQEIWCFAVTMAVCLLVGIPLVRKKPKNQSFLASDGYVAVSLSWIVLSILGAVPFVLSGYIPNPVDALFEVVSGFTTTGASILSDVEVLPKSLLFWRSFTHWIGGMGVLVFILCLLPMTGGSNMNLMKAESPGPSVSRLVPKVQSTAKILYGIYIGMTLVQILILLVSGMPAFDAVTLTFGTAGTGGFGIKNSSIADYTTFQQAVITIFMILFGVNFNVYFLILMKKFGQAFKCEEARCYLLIIAAAVGIITVNTIHLYSNAGYAFHHAAFQVASIITTTGYATVNFDLWPETSKTILVFLMFIGACAGSTGGGIKVSRIMLLAKTIKAELVTALHPRAVTRVKMDGKSVERDVIRSLNVYIAAYIIIFALLVLLISVDGFDFTTNFTAVAATFNNIGPGLSQVGPTCNFGGYSDFSKLLLTFGMLAGRLEIFPLMVLFYKETWKKF